MHLVHYRCYDDALYKLTIYLHVLTYLLMDMHTSPRCHITAAFSLHHQLRMPEFLYSWPKGL